MAGEAAGTHRAFVRPSGPSHFLSPAGSCHPDTSTRGTRERPLGLVPAAPRAALSHGPHGHGLQGREQVETSPRDVPVPLGREARRLLAPTGLGEQPRPQRAPQHAVPGDPGRGARGGTARCSNVMRNPIVPIMQIAQTMPAIQKYPQRSP